MKKQTVKPDSVAQPVFDLAIEVRDWLSSFGQGAMVQLDPDNNEQMWVLPEFTQGEMQDVGCNTFDMPELDGAWCDWYSSAVIVVGSNHSPEPFNEDDHNDFSTVHHQAKQPLDLDI